MTTTEQARRAKDLAVRRAVEVYLEDVREHLAKALGLTPSTVPVALVVGGHMHGAVALDDESGEPFAVRILIDVTQDPEVVADLLRNATNPLAREHQA